jgi:hypothetical protein
MKGVESMSENERGGFFGFGNQWIWIVVVIVAVLLIFPGIFESEHGGCYKE